MVSAAVATDVIKSRLVFIDEGLKVNIKFYLKILRLIAATMGKFHASEQQ